MSEVDPKVKDEAFRDSTVTINKEGKRNWIYAQKPKGKLYTARTLASIFFLTIFFALPFIRVNQEPFFLFNVLERKFILFGIIFWPQDFFIFGIALITFILFIILFTVIYGRVFCGWACPQTIFMEMVFRKIEYWIEGDASTQRALDKAPYDTDKIIKKALKHTVFFIIAFIIATTFLAYIIGTDEVFLIAKAPMSHIGGISSLLLFTCVFYAVYAWFREQVCLIVCPYGRLQGVMLDKNTIQASYDYMRGEPRAKYKKNEPIGKGDCIDCKQCVKVCPVGIDIRNGSQLECINCAACIDVCDFMMEKVNLPKGLIRYASENNIKNREKPRITARIIAYTTVLAALIVFLVVLLATRKDVDATILRTSGMLYQQQENNNISNLYNIKLINKTHNDIPVTLKLESDFGFIKMVGKSIIVNKTSKAESEFFIFLPKSEIKRRKTKLHIGVYSGNKRLELINTTFLGPISISNQK